MSATPPPTVPPTTPPPPGGGSYTPPPPAGGGSYTPPPPPPSGGAAGGDSSNRTMMLVLSYCWLLSLIPFFTEKNDKEVQWHAKNGLVMAIAYTAFAILFGIVARMSDAVNCLGLFVPCIIFLVYLAVQILCIVKAVNGQRFRVPVLTDFAEKM